MSEKKGYFAKLFIWKNAVDGSDVDFFVREEIYPERVGLKRGCVGYLLSKSRKSARLHFSTSRGHKGYDPLYLFRLHLVNRLLCLLITPKLGILFHQLVEIICAYRAWLGEEHPNCNISS